MKNFKKLFLLLVLTVSFVSCTPENLLEGTVSEEHDFETKSDSGEENNPIDDKKD